MAMCAIRSSNIEKWREKKERKEKGKKEKKNASTALKKKIL